MIDVLILTLTHTQAHTHTQQAADVTNWYQGQLKGHYTQHAVIILTEDTHATHTHNMGVCVFYDVAYGVWPDYIWPVFAC